MDALSATIEEKAIEILGGFDQGLPYRELVNLVSRALPETPRAVVSSVIGELPKTRSQQVWRPKPGQFKIRGTNEGPTVYTRGRKRKQREQPAKRVAWPERPLPNRQENLARIGFTRIGAWQASDQGLECVIDSDSFSAPALLAYIIDGNVVYLARTKQNGSATGQVGGYVARSIRQAISRGKSIQVYALFGWEPIQYKGMDIDVSAGIVDELIERMQPPWNNFAA